MISGELPAMKEQMSIPFVLSSCAHQAYMHEEFERQDPGFWHCLKVKT